VAILANLVLIPLGSLVIISGFLSLLGGLAGFAHMVSLFNHASVLLLKLSEWIVHRCTELPGAFLAAEFVFEAMGYPVLAGLLAALLWGYAHDWTGKRGCFWIPFVFTALVLATCLQRVAAVAGKT
jgi:competence protein ComEC